MSEDNSKLQEMQDGFKTAFINQSINSNLAYRPEFLSNNYKKGKKVLVSIEQELADCDEFKISVAFITKSGITPLLQTLEELERKNIPGKILTTNYLNFSEPEAVEKLSNLKNIELKMFRIDSQTSGFHTKGYIFRKEEIYRFIIGSSNMTLGAVTKNREWNTKIVSTIDGEIAQDILSEFEELWNDDHSVDYDLIKEVYEKEFLREKIAREQRRLALQDEVVSLEKYRLKPNKMQTEFVANLLEMRKAQIDKALLLSSTGTGKTYASAFAMRELGFKRVLFLVHRNQIAGQARASFEKVFGGSIKTGLVTGKHQDYEADYVFATVQTLSKEENLKRFSPDYFDCCIYDEAHHTAANSYKRVMDYFKPQLALGMTATPDRRDDDIEGRNIYQLFDHNIAYEIRLQQAMEEDILCPFHYFGITDLELINDNEKGEEKLEIFRRLTSDERVNKIIEKAGYYGYSGDRVKGLIFCSRRDEAKELSRKLNERGFRTVALSGEDSEEARAKAVERLVMDENIKGDDYEPDIITDEGPLDYILSVDIFSEGVDVPQINQVIMLRPTQSPIVFVQQLGRGLRKAEGKEYVVVLDFIGNYKNNFMIPIALSGDRTYNKDNIRRHVIEGARVIPGESTIHFDEISRKKIFEAIDSANFSDVKLIKENYFNLRNKLGRIPKLEDFDKYGEMDVLRIFENKSLGSYHIFLKKYEKEYKIKFPDAECEILGFVSGKLASGKRIQELLILRGLLEEFKNPSGTGVFEGLNQKLKDLGKEGVTENQKVNLVNVMTNEFPTGTGKKEDSPCVFIESDGDRDYRAAETFAEMLKNSEFYDQLREVVDFGIRRNQTNYSDTYEDTDLVLYQKYSYEDVCRLLNWEKNVVSLNIGGYKYDKETKTFPVFINYDKKNDISDTIKYEDRFIDRRSLIAISKSGRTKDSEDVQKFLHAEEWGIKVELFVRKNVNDKGSKEFYYLGRMAAREGVINEFIMQNTQKTAVEIQWYLDVPVREDIYEYIVNG